MAWLAHFFFEIISLPSASLPAIERWPQGSLMCTLGGSMREKQKIRGEEEEEEEKEEEEEEKEETKTEP